MIRFRDLPYALFRFQAKNCNSKIIQKNFFEPEDSERLGLVPIQRILFSYFKIISLISMKVSHKGF